MNEERLSYPVAFAEAVLAGIKALDRPQDIAALTAARDELQRNPRAGAVQADGLRRLHVEVDDDPERISLLYRFDGSTVLVVWVFAGP
ncbi:hypothetical protein I5Q34_33425 [Streptomyces sp. AV19]|uniref:hypothetical protein n=1 Tax=Streptomyces sp. AV19 TaxID=2793068 RepID=UPI0018FE5ABA|nr:hypothetical protein [Streptomyces sp. AV19]MBH1939105.1 hypothetical protein [Streptomyces sp. AV19]MDG4534253.1 hypothetical protein [Streptomyces sp. AV19]